MVNRVISVLRINLVLVLLLLLFLEACNPSGKGCTDPLANNLEAEATENDGSCTYEPVWIEPDRTLELSSLLSGTSGLIFWDRLLWSHNDHDDNNLYGIDTATAEINREYLLPEVGGNDWEDIAEDGEYIYMGDFGNNASGNRTDLHILRIDKSTLLSGDATIDTLWFTYSDQNDFVPAESNQTEFDCEAMIAYSGNIYLFTKQWLTGNTTLYSLPKTPGSHIAQKISSYQADGLISGATALEQGKVVVLCAYTGALQPFLLLLYDYKEHDFLSGNIRRINLSLPFHQVEGITTVDGLHYYISNESHTLPGGSIVPQKLFYLDLGEYLQEYLKPF